MNPLDENLQTMNKLTNISRIEFFCELGDTIFGQKFFIRPKKPSTFNYMFEYINRREGNLNGFYRSFNTNLGYCNLTDNAITTQMADNHQINFFMHRASNSELLLYSTSIMSKTKLDYLGVVSMGMGNASLISYLQGVKTGIKIIDIIDSLRSTIEKKIEQSELSNYFIFSKNILDAYNDWYVNYGWLEGVLNKTSIRKSSFDNWLTNYGPIDNDDKKISNTLDKKWPVINEFCFTNPVSLKYCLKIIISDNDMNKSKLLQLLKRLCPNTFMNLDTFEKNRKTFNFIGENAELINLNYDLIYLFIEEYPNVDIAMLDDTILQKFKINNGINHFYYFKPPSRAILLADCSFDISSIRATITKALFDSITRDKQDINDIIVYNYFTPCMTEDNYKRCQETFNRFIRSHGYGQNIYALFIGLMIDNKIIRCDTTDIREQMESYDLNDINIDNTSLEELKRTIMQRLSEMLRHDGIDYGKKYLKYKTKYLRYSNRL
jgi:hypothetical protein